MDKININYIAKALGVAKSSVSKALNGKSGVSESTRRKIQEFVKRINYQPSPHAQLLTTGKSRYIALILPHINNPFAAEIIKGLLVSLSSYDYRVVVDTSRNDPKLERETIEDLLRRAVDGFIIVPSYKENGVYLNKIAKQVPLVILDQLPPKFKGHYVGTDFSHGSKLAIKSLYELGHRKIGLILGPEYITSSAERLEGYREILRELGLPFDPKIVFHTESNSDVGKINLVKNKHLLMTSCVCATAQIAGAMLDLLNTKGIKAPEEFSIIDFGNDTYFSTLDQKPNEITDIATKTLLQLINGESPPLRTLIKPSLVPRYTTQPHGTGVN